MEQFGHQAVAQQKSASIRFGFYNEKFPVVGKSVADVRSQIQGMWNVPADAVGFNGKTRLEDNYIIQEGDEIEFQRRTGEKG